MLRYSGAMLLLACSVAAQTTFSLKDVSAPGPLARLDAPIAYDAAGNQLLLFGGQESLGDRNDIWSFSLATKTWTQLRPAGPLPGVRHGHTLIFDPVRRRAVTFAGQVGTFYSDVWAYDVAGNQWTQLAGQGEGPSARYGHSAVYDPKLDRMIISHGFTTAGRFDDTWSFSFASNSWKELLPPGVRPAKRCLHHAAIDEARNVMYLYGGCSSGFGPCPQDDLWVFDLATNVWQEISGSPRPPGRYHNGLAFDSARRKLVVYGGTGPTGLLSDAWEFDPALRSWALATGTSTLPARYRHETAYADGETYYFGGLAPNFVADLLRLRLPGPRISSVRNAFSGAVGAVAPGEIVAVYGEDLGTVAGKSAAYSNGALPSLLGEVSVMVNGVSAPLFYAGADQINLQIPYEVAGSETGNIVVRTGQLPSASAAARVASSAPGLFNGAWNGEFTMNSTAAPASAGSVIVFFATGYGRTIPAQTTGVAAGASLDTVTAGAVDLRVGGVSAALLYAGPLPGTAGVLQINARVPQGVTKGDAVPVTLSVGGTASAGAVNIVVR